MDEHEFRKVLELFPVVRSRDYHADLDASSSRQLTQSASSSRQMTQSASSSRQMTQSASSSRQLTQSASSERGWQDALNDKDRGGAERSGNYNHEAFWGKLKLAAEQKVGSADAEKICKAFQQVYKRLVNEELTLDAAKSFMNSKHI